MTNDPETCPFDSVLSRTPYLVMPKLAIQVMPMEWRKRLAALLDEAEDAGLSTPSYIVFRSDSSFTLVTSDPDGSPLDDVVEPLQYDPWADYRHRQIEKVRELCPNFQIGQEDASAPHPGAAP